MEMKKTVYRLSVMVLAAVLFPLCALADDISYSFGSVTWYDYRDANFDPDPDAYNNGTFYNPFVIDTPEKLAQLSWLVNEQHRSYAGKIFTLGADINLDKTVGGKKVCWVPIGYREEHPFDGMFLGMEKSLQKPVWQEEYSHTISGMYINASLPISLGTIVCCGLFGHARGYIGHLRLTDCSVSITSNGTTSSSSEIPHGYTGLLCGYADEQGYSDESNFEEMATSYFHAPHGIYNVSVGGSITVSGSVLHIVGGIVGMCSNYGVCHSTADVTATYANPYFLSLGGICGTIYEKQAYDTDASINDCSAHIVLSSDDHEVKYVGGIVGAMEAGTSVTGCTSSGSLSALTSTAKSGLGGICGFMSKPSHVNSYIQGCASTMLLEGKNNVGGIVGCIDDGIGSNISADALVDRCVFAGSIRTSSGNRVGGICGYLQSAGTDSEDESIPAATGLYVNEALMAGTMLTGESENVGIIAGFLPTPKDNAGGCYYDATLCKGDVIGGNEKHASIRGLTTDVLTSGSEAKVYMLTTDETAPLGFTFSKGYYPQVFCHKEWPGYKVLEGNTVRLSQTYPYWRYASVDKSNSVYLTGAWLASVPVTIPLGDAAYDLVTYVIGKAKEGTWNETDGREVKVKASVAYPATDIISVSGDTARVLTNGEFLSTITMKTVKGTAMVFNRPLPVGGTKVLGINATPDQVWDGSFSSEFAAGTGKAEDPYIIKNGAQLAYAVQHNSEGQFYKQLCDITLVKDLIDYSSNFMGIKDSNHANNLKWGGTYASSTNPWNREAMSWKARYDGDGHLVKGAYMVTPNFGLFGDIAASGVVENLGITDSYVAQHKGCGILASKVEGTVSNCLFQGVVSVLNTTDGERHKSYCGGICAYIGTENSEARIEDCVTAVYCNRSLTDFSPFVSLPESDNALQNKGKVQHCLAVVPTSFGDATYNYEYTADGRSYIQNCYWLLGYEPTATGYTLDAICTALSNRKLWTYSKGYFPTLKTFAQKDIARLMTLPVRTDEGYDDEGFDQYLLGFDRQLLFEPGNAVWTSSDVAKDYIDADGEMGIVVPLSFTYDYKNMPYIPQGRWVLGQQQLVAQLGKTIYGIPVRTRGGQVNPGITIEDTHAREACMNAFDTDGDGILSLDEVKAVDEAAMHTAFQNTQAATAQQTETFTELRFFKGVTSLTTQLNGFSQLTEVKLPYALETIGSDAFNGCTSLKEVTIPAKVSWTDPHPFYGSAVENISVDPFNEDFTSRDGVLFDVNDVLIAYPNGRTGEEIVLEGRIIEFAEGAIYKQSGLQRLYFETEDYETVPYLNFDGIVTADGQLIDIYVCDATYGSVLMQSYIEDGSWDEYVDAGKLHCYYPLNVGRALAATMYIGFDTELPSELTPYIVTMTDKNENAAYLKRMSRKVPNRSPVVIMATKAGKYRLTPLDEKLESWKMYENRLNGVGRDGMSVNQGDSDRGSILTLGYNSSGTLGFFFYKGSRIPPYRAYLTYNWVEDQNAQFFIFFVEDDDPTGIGNAASENCPGTDNWFDMSGRRLNGKPTQRGLYIVNGKKVIIK